MMNPASASFRHRERGGITIMVVLMLLVLLTIAAVSMSKNAVREVIIAGTSARGPKSAAWRIPAWNGPSTGWNLPDPAGNVRPPRGWPRPIGTGWPRFPVIHLWRAASSLWVEDLHLARIAPPNCS